MSNRPLHSRWVRMSKHRVRMCSFLSVLLYTVLLYGHREEVVRTSN